MAFRGVPVGEAPDGLLHGPHGGAGPDEALGAGVGRRRRHGAGRQHGVEHAAQLGVVDRLGQVVGRPEAHGLDGVGGRGVGGDDGDGRRIGPRAGAPDWGTGGKVAHIPRIEWQVIPDSATAAAALQRGEIDWWERPLNDLLPVLGKSRDIQTEVQDPTGRMALMRLNHLQPPFNDPAIRRAVLMSVDQEEYMRAANGDDGVAG